MDKKKLFLVSLGHLSCDINGGALPAILPFFLSAIRSALGFAWNSGIAAEVLGRPARAIGSQIYDSKIYLETPDLFAWTLVVILLSVLLERLAVRFVRWAGKRSMRVRL